MQLSSIEVIGIAFLVFFTIEWLFGKGVYYSQSEKELIYDKRRIIKNISIGLIFRGLYIPFALPLVAGVMKEVYAGFPSLNVYLTDHPALHFAISFLAYDFSKYLTHWISHKIPFLWRFHAVHHLDNQLDASTGLRQHFFEKFLTSPIAILFVVLFSITSDELIIIGLITVFNGMFHHSRIPISDKISNCLSHVFTVPKYHAVHHVAKREYTDSNYGFFFSIWDTIFSTVSVRNISNIINPNIGLKKGSDPSFLKLIYEPFLRAPLSSKSKR